MIVLYLVLSIILIILLTARWKIYSTIVKYEYENL